MLILKSHTTSRTFLYCCTIGVLFSNNGVIRPTAKHCAKTPAKDNHETNSGPHHGGHAKGKPVGCFVAVETFRIIVWRV